METDSITPLCWRPCWTPGLQYSRTTAGGLQLVYSRWTTGVRMLDGEVTDVVEAHSLSLNPQHIHVYSASWGPDDDGKSVDGPAKLAKEAFLLGITKYAIPPSGAVATKQRTRSSLVSGHRVWDRSPPPPPLPIPWPLPTPPPAPNLLTEYSSLIPVDALPSVVVATGHGAARKRRRRLALRTLKCQPRIPNS
ncbi:unnamed protein product [Arctogadus glacialis]